MEFAVGSDTNTLLAHIKIHKLKVSARVGGSYNGNQWRVELTTF